MATRLSAVAVPTEHGGWSLTLEPVLLGLMVAPGGAGLALGGCALLAFLARTPLKLALGDRWRKRRLERSALAEAAAAGYLVLLMALLVTAFLLTDFAFWQPLAIAAPLIAVEAWFDIRSRSRRLLAEMAGTIGVGSVAAAIVLAGGESGSVAAGVWSVVAARAIATIPFVRLQLKRAKSQPHRVGTSDASQLAALMLVGAVALLGWAPWPAVAAIAVLAGIQAWFSRIAVPRTAIIGAQQVVLGLGVVLLAGLAFAAP